MSFGLIIAVALLIALLLGTLLAAMRRYKTCPPNAILVIHGKTGEGSAKVLHGGAAFVWPLIQQHNFLSVAPLTSDIPLKGALSRQNIRVSVPTRVTYCVGTTPELMRTAAEKLLGLSQSEIEDTAKDIIFGQLRAVIATLSIEELNQDRDAFESKVQENLEVELAKVGLRLINVNIADIQDESGYIEALGKKAGAEAVNRALVEVAQQEREGATGQAQAKQEERTAVAAAEAKAVAGENEAKATIEASNADLAEAKAEAKRRASAAEAVKAAQAQAEGYASERDAETMRAERDRATEHANKVVPAEIRRKTLVIEAEAQRDQERLRGEGEGQATLARMKGEAEGMLEILNKKAEGFKKLVEAAGGNPDKAAMLLIVEQMPQIVEAQARAISNIDFEKVVVYDGGGADGSRTAEWLSGLVKSLPQLHDFAAMAGIALPRALGASLAQAGEPGEPTNVPALGNAEANTSNTDAAERT